MRPYVLVSLLLAGLMLPGMDHASEDTPIRVLILSGQNNHDWEKTTPKLKAILEETGRFQVEITEAPGALTPAALEGIGVIVSNWNTFGRKGAPAAVTQWSEPARRALLDFVRGGNGHVVVHAGGSSFSDWRGYQRMIGGASWKLKQTNHGPRHVFQVRTAREDNPIAEGIGTFHTQDELWNDTGIDEDATVIAEAFSSEEHHGSGRWEPIAAVNHFGKGRNFTLLLGHDVIGMTNPGFRALLVRGAEWAATGQVCIPFSKNLPENAKTVETQNHE